ncbi:MAG: xyloglucanase [Clostridium sp.]|nr:xyloglucanase [Clostridium sp.]
MKNKLNKTVSALLMGALVLPTTGTINVEASTGPDSAKDTYKSNYTWNKVNTGAGGGFIPAIIFNKGEKDLIYTRTDMGGAYRWDPETSTWIGLSDWVAYDDWNQLGCESLAADPIETNRVYVLSGTYTNDWTSDNGCILRSTDKGDHWEKTDLPFKVGGNMPGRSMGERLVIDPVANNVLYLGSHKDGLWRSEDYGVTWNKVEGFTAEGNYIDPNFKDQTGVVWAEFDPTSAPEGTTEDGKKLPCQTIYVGVADTKQSIYVTHDGGKTWEPLEGQPTLDNQSSWIDNNDNKNPQAFLPHHGNIDANGNLFITYSNGCGPYDGSKGDVWRYNTKTKEWKNVSPVPSSNTSDNYFGYGALALDAKHPGTLVVMALNSWWPDTQMFRSTDSGEHWTPIWNWDGYPNRVLRYTQDISKAPWLNFGGNPTFPEPEFKLGWMTGGASIDPFNSDRMMYGTGATIYGTNNLSDWKDGSKVNISVMAQGIEEESVSKVLSLSKSKTPLITGMGDVCGFRHEDLTKVPDQMFTVPNFSTSDIDYSENEQNFLVRVGNVLDDDKSRKKSIAFSYNEGKNWFQGTDIEGIKGDAGGTVAVSPNSKVVLWAPSGTGTRTPHYSTNNGSSWTKVKGLPDGAKVISDRVNSDKFYGFSDGEFYVSTDGAKTFTKTAAEGLPKDGTRSCKAVPGHEGDIWIASGTKWGETYGIWHSTDSGETFTKLENVEEADSIGFGKAAEGKDYFALYTNAKINGVRGIFRSDDAGETWVRINDSEHQYGCASADISGDYKVYGRVYLATNGLGVAYGDMDGTVIPKDPDPKPDPKPDTKVILGDIDGNGKIDTLDYVKLKLYLSHKYKGTDITVKNADLDEDGNITVKDLLALRMMI